MTDWCPGSNFGLKEGLIPFLKDNPDFPILVVFVGNSYKEDKLNLANDNFKMVYRSRTFTDLALAHKLKIMAHVRKFNDSDPEFSVPITLFINKNRRVLEMGTGMNKKRIEEVVMRQTQVK